MNNSLAGRALACVMGDLNMVRAVGWGGIPCAVVTHAQDQALYSRFTRTALYWDDFEENPERLVDALVAFGTAQPEPPVLFYQFDAQLLLVSRYRQRLSEAFRFVIPDPVLVEDLVDKARFQALAERLSLPVPSTRRILFSAGPTPRLDLDLRFPLIIKPLTRFKSWGSVGGSGKALQVGTKEALLELWPRLRAAGMDVLAQEMIPGAESRIESYHVYVDRQGDIAGEFTGRKIRTYPQSYGHSTALTITDTADVAELGRSLVKRLNLQGVAKFDFKRGPDGELYLLEVNPRFNLWHYLGAVAGVNLPALVYADMVGVPRPVTSHARAGACWCQVKKDRLAARDSGIPFPVWLAWVMRCEAKTMVWDDPMPTLRNALSRFLPVRSSHA